MELKQKLKNATQNLETSLFEKKVNRWLITRGLIISVILFFSSILISFFLFKHSFLIAILDGFLGNIMFLAGWVIYGRFLLKIQQMKDFPMISLPELFSLKYDNWVIWVLCGGFALGFPTFFFFLYFLYFASWSPLPMFLQNFPPTLRLIPLILSIILSFVGAPYLMSKLRKKRKNEKANYLKRQKTENSNSETNKKPLGRI